jgi:hypothetical protein
MTRRETNERFEANVLVRKLFTICQHIRISTDYVTTMITRVEYRLFVFVRCYSLTWKDERSVHEHH